MRTSPRAARPAALLAVALAAPAAAHDGQETATVLAHLGTAAAAWLALADEGRWAEAWDAAAPALQAEGSRRRYAAMGLLRDEEEGKVVSRAPAALLHARSLPGSRPPRRAGRAASRPGPATPPGP
jgi:hypothetical protein